MPHSLSDIIQYFRDCYRSDNRELTINDFLDSKVEDKIFIEGKEELLNGDFPKIPIDALKASNALKKLEIFKKEKQLIYGSFFICGRFIDMRGEVKRLCAPLFYHPADIVEKDEFFYLSIRPEERRINYPLISLLARESTDDILLDPIFKKLPNDFVKFEHIGTIVELCKKYFETVDFENIYAYPDNIPVKKVKSTITKLSKGDINSYVLLPTSMLGIISKSSNTRGVLNELMELASGADFSKPLQALLSNVPAVGNGHAQTAAAMPMILSEAQKAILKSAAKHPLTLIVGPPGTGKTYTIGAVALEHMSRGESVLIASRTDEAVDVIAEKIKEQIGFEKCVVRGGKKRSYSTPLNRFLKALLTRTATLRYLLKTFDLPTKYYQALLDEKISELEETIENRKFDIEELEGVFSEEVQNEMEWGDHLSKEEDSLWNMLKTKYLDLRNTFQTPIWEYNETLHLKDEEQISDILQLLRMRYVRQINEVVTNNWNDIKLFHEALKLLSDTDKLKKFDQINFDVILKAFPIWMTNLSEVKDVLPFKKEMFDVLIIDEATQCDIASCLPLIQRAKRVVFAGDPAQLRHVSFVSRSMQSIFRSKYNLQGLDDARLNYRDKSILDLTMNGLQSGEQVAMLDEHFRSLSPIIAFSNKHFYDNELKILTARPDQKEQSLYFVDCNGKRDKQGINQIEVDTLLSNVDQLIQAEIDLSEELCTTVGILSPFRAQVDALAKELLDKFSVSDISKHKIRVGTAYSFQGEERDIMHLSFAVNSESHHAAFQHVNKEDVFNVSITRARSRQYIYLSVSRIDLKKDSLLRAYISGTHEKQSVNKQASGHDKFLKEVSEQIEQWGIHQQWPGFPFAGMKIDLLVKVSDKYFGINLVGYPGEYEDAYPMERYRILNRAGIHMFPLPYSDWYFENENTGKILKAFLLPDDMET